GVVTTGVLSMSLAHAIALQSDGKIVVAGSAVVRASADPLDFGLARYNSNGTLDTTFGGGGTVTTDLSGHNDEAVAIATQDDGKILVTGYAGNLRADINNTGDFAVVRYNANGALDTTFGANGVRITDFFGNQDFGLAIALQTDGGIVVAGRAKASSSAASI